MSVLEWSHKVASNVKRLTLCSLVSITTVFASEQPNIIVIMSDDAGYADIGFSGNRLNKANFETPNLDSLASSGVIFDQGYTSASVCSPSRAGMLTGRYQQRFGHEYNLPVTPEPGDVEAFNGLNVDELTMADHLKAAGYSTGLIGKWHLGLAPQFHPNARGFDYFYGLLGGGRSYWEGEGQDTDYRRIYRNKSAENYQGYLTDRLGEEAISFIKNNQQNPFFLFLSYTAVHAPMEAKPEYLSQFSHIKDKQRQTLAAMTLSLDESVGEVMSALEEQGLRENTLVVFLNDNGGPSDYNFSSNLPLVGVKGTLAEGGVRVPFAMSWPGHIKAGTSYQAPISALDILPTALAAAKSKPANKKPLDGVNLLPYLNGELQTRPHQTLYWKRAAFAAVRDGDYKLIRFPDRPAVLYDLKSDPYEKTDLSMRFPDKSRAMLKKLFSWENELQAPLFLTHSKWVKQNRQRYTKYTNVDDDAKSK